MLERFDGDLHLALAAYNKGPGHVQAWRASGAPLPKPRVPYVTRVLRAANAFCARAKHSKYERESGPFVCPSNHAPVDEAAITLGDDADTDQRSQDRLSQEVARDLPGAAESTQDATVLSPSATESAHKEIPKEGG